MRPFSIVVLLVVLSLSPGLWAQQPQDPPTAEPNPADTADGHSNADTDLAAEVQQLRQEVDRLRREVSLLQSELDQVRSEHALAEVANPPAVPEPQQKSSPPAAPVGRTKSSRATASRAQPSSPPAAFAAPEADDKAPTTVIVFRDGHRTEVKNYAIIGQTLWVYTEDDSKKIPLADVDLAATKNANSERGVTFQLPPAP